jgi:P27 family predicted phage terminase small subunit
MRPGPKPEPTRLKIARGNPGRRKLNHQEPTPEPLTDFKAPAWLNREAKREWKRVVAELGPLGVLTVLDVSALCANCVAWSEMRAAEDIIQRDGVVITDQYGKQMKHPAVAVKNAALTAMLRWGAELGLTPSSRTRLRVPSKPSTNAGPPLVDVG